MGKKIVLTAVLILILASFAGLAARADTYITINTYGATPFLYQGRSYIPLRSASSFLGAPLQWEGAQNRSIMIYNGRELILIAGSRDAWFEGQPILLSAAPMIGDGRLFIPLDALRITYGIPMEWDRVNSRVIIKGEKGWGEVRVSRRPPGWAQGRKTGWAKHGNPNRPPGLSKNKQPGPPAYKNDKGKGKDK